MMPSMRRVWVCFGGAATARPAGPPPPTQPHLHHHHTPAPGLCGLNPALGRQQFELEFESESRRATPPRQVCRKLRELYPYSCIPIIMVSAKSKEEHTEELRALSRHVHTLR